MKLMLRPEYRLWPLNSFLTFLDIKTGVTLALLFAVLNKVRIISILVDFCSQQQVAGVYGLIAVVTGAGGSFAQLSLYIYSVLALVALVWGLKAVRDVRVTLNPPPFAHVRHRRTQNKPSISPTSFSQIMSFQPRGQSTLPSSGGSRHPMTEGDPQIHPRRNKS